MCAFDNKDWLNSSKWIIWVKPYSLWFKFLSEFERYIAKRSVNWIISAFDKMDKMNKPSLFLTGIYQKIFEVEKETLKILKVCISTNTVWTRCAFDKHLLFFSKRTIEVKPYRSWLNSFKSLWNSKKLDAQSGANRIVPWSKLALNIRKYNVGSTTSAFLKVC